MASCPVPASGAECSLAGRQITWTLKLLRSAGHTALISEAAFASRKELQVTAVPSHMLCIVDGVFTSSRNEFKENTTTAPDSSDCATPPDLAPRVEVCFIFVGSSVWVFRSIK